MYDFGRARSRPQGGSPVRHPRPMRGPVVALALVALAALSLPARAQAPAPAAATFPDAPRLDAMAARFAPVDIGADVSALPAGERTALARLVDAARLMDPLFVRQSWG